MTDELVSIITPTYNCGKFIGESIDSVLAQTYHNWELIIVDDCSIDETAEVVSKYADNNDRIKYFCLEKNSGAAVARNKALSLARGKWIAFLDSDDLWMPEKLEHQIKFMRKNGYSFSYHCYEEIDERGKLIGVSISGPKKVSRLGMLAYCWPGCLTVMYDRESIGLIQIPEIKKNNDYAMWLIASNHADCYKLDECLARYRKRVGSISNHSKINLIKWHFKLFRIVEKRNSIMASILTCNNLFWGIVKKIFYVKYSPVE